MKYAIAVFIVLILGPKAVLLRKSVNPEHDSATATKQANELLRTFIREIKENVNPFTRIFHRKVHELGKNVRNLQKKCFHHHITSKKRVWTHN